jgi:hypothetical protein
MYKTAAILISILTRVADPHHFADPDPVIHFNADPGCCFSRIRIQILFKEMGICDHYGGLKTLQASIVSVHGPSLLYFEPHKLLTLMPMRIRIQLFTLMRMCIRIQLPKIMLIRIRNLDFDTRICFKKLKSQIWFCS